MMACGSSRPVSVAPTPPRPTKVQLQLAVIPAESDAFPRAAQAVSESLAQVRLAGTDTTVSKVSLEVVQLSIECVDPTDACYQAIGRSMSANRLLFARIDPGAKRRGLRMTVTLYDVDRKAARHTAEKRFATEDEAIAGAADLVAEATR